MVIYWFFLMNSFFVGFLSIFIKRKVHVNGNIEERPNILSLIVFFGLIVLFIGLRSGIADTAAYIAMFKKIPTLFSQIHFLDVTRDRGFYFLQFLFKKFVSVDYHYWLFFVCFISCSLISITFYKYASFFWQSAFLFIVTTNFTYLFNGMRQFLAVALLFALIDFVLHRKFLFFSILVILISLIHGSAIIMIPAYFFVTTKPWSNRFFLMLAILFFLILNINDVLKYIDPIIDNTQYRGYVDLILVNSKGSSIYRLFLAAVSPFLAFINRNHNKMKSSNELYKICINMSVFNLSIMLVSTLTYGLFIGRLAIYFEIYNLLLLPWLINTFYKKYIKLILLLSCIVMYIYYFYYQMVVVWKLYYVSDILKLFLFR